MKATPLEDQAQIFTTHLKLFVDSMAFQLDHTSVNRTMLLDDIENDPHWFDKWADVLSSSEHMLVFMVGAKAVLEAYAAARLGQTLRARLEDGA